MDRLESDDKAVAPIIKPFRNLSQQERNNFVVESMILFPEMFGNSQTKFERVAAYLITRHNAVSASLRDNFTAGGQGAIKLKGVEVIVPKLLCNLYEAASAIKTKIDQIDEDTLLNYWRCEKIEDNRIEQWMTMIDASAKTEAGPKPSEVFVAGLSR